MYLEWHNEEILVQFHLLLGGCVLISIVVMVVLVHLAFATAIYLDAIKRPRLFVLPIIWFVATLLFGMLTVVAYNTSKHHQ